ncbi:PREDICTED: uncharacterized protein LOC107168144 [Diuraphis noxia]|uniref:uncharacterized protein LOC107168144 n=1 Tax=Diuraphis noxia TaxID=143948 RepID=UPI0007637DAD|nr:PREDICTED: uncharacterized protein LOC107168144 [Diuraphis noxia]
MIRSFVVLIAVSTFSRFNCKTVIHKAEGQDSVIRNNLSLQMQNETTANLETDNPAITNDDKVVTSQNKTTKFQKNITSSTAQRNESAVVEHDNSRINRKLKTRQVPADVLVTSSSTMVDSMNADQSYYQSPLMVYPFPMMNTYYPRYFPYTYPGYQGYPFFG